MPKQEVNVIGLSVGGMYIVARLFFSVQRYLALATIRRQLVEEKKMTRIV